jgi:putative membrane protein
MINRHLAGRIRGRLGRRLLLGGLLPFAPALPSAALAASVPRDTSGDASPLKQAGERAPEGPPRAMTAPELATLQKLHDANQTEIEMGSLAREKGSTKVVREFGRKLIADDTAADRMLDEYLGEHASSTKTLATTSADPAHELLANKTGAEFDRAFGVQMVADHTKAIELIESARIEIRDGQLRDLYDGLLPALYAHKRTAQDIVAASVRS